MPNRFDKNRLRTGNSTYKPTADHVYVDVKLGNTGSERGVPIVYNQQRLEPILDNPSNYYLSLIRWKIPAFALPILIFPIADPDASSYLSSYSITLVYNNIPYQEQLFYTNQNGSSLEPPLTSEKFYFVYYEEHFMTMVNSALQRAFDSIPGVPVGATAPELIFEAESRLFSLIAQQANYEVDVEPIPPSQPTFNATIRIYFSYGLYQLFNGLPFRTVAEALPEASNGRDVQLIVQTFENNTLPGSLLSMVQNFQSLSIWSPVKQLEFTTALLPISSEFTSASGDSFKKIMTNFEPLSDNKGGERDMYQYFPQGPYRLVDMVGTNPIYSIDLRVTWSDIEGNDYPVEITSLQQFSAKLLFVKRNLYKSDNILYEH